MLQQEDSFDGRQDALRLDVIAAIVGQDEDPASRFNGPQALQHGEAGDGAIPKGDEFRGPGH